MEKPAGNKLTKEDLEVQNRTDALQKEMHHLIDMIKKSSTMVELDYQDMANVFILKKLAELDLKVEKLIKDNAFPLPHSTP